MDFERELASPYQRIYRTDMQMLPPFEHFLTVAPVAPLSLAEGERRLREALAEKDWLTALGVAQRLARSAGWEEYLLACAKQPDSIWESAADAMRVPLRRLAAADAEYERLYDSLEALPTRAARLPVIRRMQRLYVVRGFQRYCWDRLDTQGAVVVDNPAQALLHYLATIAFLTSPAVLSMAETTGDLMAACIQEEHLLPGPQDES